jgi:hypothetical protein
MTVQQCVVVHVRVLFHLPNYIVLMAFEGFCQLQWLANPAYQALSASTLQTGAILCSQDLLRHMHYTLLPENLVVGSTRQPLA